MFIKREKSAIIETIRTVMPAVVSIVISKDVDDLRKEMPELFRNTKKGASETKIPNDRIDADGRVQVGGGSGFIVHENGIILTNKHVIAESNAKYLVITSDNTSHEAEVIARDPINDVAILRIATEKPLPTVSLGDSSKLELGQTVIAFGNALGIFKNTVSSGIISGLSRSISAQSEPMSRPQELRGLIQTDAAINPGNSGGPLVDIFGRTIGINAAVVFGAQNISFAIPIHAALRDLEDLKKHGRIRRPLLGLRYLMLTEDLEKKMKLSVDYGAYITREHPMDEAVVAGSPAHKAGILEGDIILEWNGEKLTQEKNIQDFLENCNVNETVALKVMRDGKESSVSVTLAERK